MRNFLCIAFFVLAAIASCKVPHLTINHYPEYGHYHKTPGILNNDNMFIQSAEKKFGNKTLASQKYADLGWYYFQKGVLDTSMFRFNQSWLLDSSNANAYWGFAALTGKNGYYKESADYFRKSWSIDSTNKNLPLDWSISLLSQFNKTYDKSLVNEAINVINKAIKLDASNAHAYFTLAICNFYISNYNESWLYIHKAKDIDEKVINSDFINSLLTKQADPKGFYKK